MRLDRRPRCFVKVDSLSEIHPARLLRLRTNSAPDVVFCAVIAGVLGLTACSPKRESQTTPVAAEVLAGELKLSDGRLFQLGQTNPFVGLMIEKYPEGSVKSRSVVSNGVLWGVSEGWHTNGQLQVREFFKSGVSDGIRTKWETNGVKISEASIVGGKLNGPFKKWHPNGLLSEQVEMKNGNPDGVARAWYPSGCPKSEVLMADGKIVEQKHWADGELPAAVLADAKQR